MVTLGAWPDPEAKGLPFTSGDEQAGVFMHELGHTLGLGHGGGDDINDKPNYHSVMNYLWSMPEPWMYESWLGRDENGNDKTDDTVWALDYSEQVLPTLDETNLTEANGVGGTRGVWFEYPPDSGDVMPEFGNVDWNLNNSFIDTGVQQDINDSDGSLEPLVGFEDWSHLQYSFLESPFFNGPADGLLDDGGITYEEWEKLSGLIPSTPSPGTIELSEASYQVHQNVGVVTIGVARTGGTTGPVAIHYATSSGTAAPGVDYIDTAGDLNFIDGQLSDTFTIPILDDTLAEGDETFTITLSEPTGGAVLGSRSAAIVTIDIDTLKSPESFTVTNTEDSGSGSLRQAILDANDHLGDDTIDFDIVGGPIILLESPLPPITDPVVIDATTQPGYQGTPLIQVTGLLAGDGATGLTILAGQTTVKGLIIDGFNVGLELEGGSNTIQGDWIGPDVTGTLDLGNLAEGIDIPIDSSQNKIGGIDPDDRDVISDNQGPGLIIDGSDNRVLGNDVGTDATGLLALGNSVGIVITGPGNVIGDSAAGAGNLISGNFGDGIDLLGTAATGNTIQGNIIGLDSSQGDSVGNQGVGLLIEEQSSHNLIGGAGTGAGNVINNDKGIGIELNDTSFNRIEGNVVTAVVGPDGDEEEESGPAILLDDASDNMIGGTDPGAGNTITSDDAGVAILSGTGDAIRGNAIFVNDAIGIDLGWDGSTDNDPGDADTGANELQNTPVVSSATLVGQSVVIAGDLDSTPLTAFSIDLYASLDFRPTGEAYLTTAAVVTDATGHVHWSASVPTDALDGYLVTATATDPQDNTSEFAPSLELDVDGDGLTDRDESFADNNGDANMDGIADRFQPNVASIGALISFVAPAGTQFRDVGFADNPSPFDVPNHGVFPQGLFTWRLVGLAPGASTTVQLLLPDFINSNAYYRYGPTPGQLTSHWDTFEFDGTTGAEIGPQTVTLHLVDGGRGDDDLTPDGAIEQVGGPVDGPETFLVTNTNDDGPGSFRQAILDSNAHAATDTIAFAIGSGPATIAPIHFLPTITDPVVIDGTTQPGFAGQPLIELSGSNIGDVTETGDLMAGLVITSGSTTVRGLDIDGFADRLVTVHGSDFLTFLDVPGILIQGNGGNVIVGNYIGTDLTGTVAKGNDNGIYIEDSSDNRIGGTESRDRNVISGNLDFGINLFGTSGPMSGNVVEGNFIGTQSDGVSPLGNGQAVLIDTAFSDGGGVALNAESSDATIGGTATGAANVIAFNLGTGIMRVDGQGTFLENSIYANGLLGIETYNAHDDQDGDGGYGIGGSPYGGPNYPILNSALYAGDSTVIQGRINDRPDTTLRIEFFSSTSFDRSGFGEGQTFLGASTVTTDATGNASFTATVPTIDPSQQFVTATATDASGEGETSQFSARLAVGDVLGSVYTVNTADDHDDGVADATDTSLREAIIAANNHPGLDIIRFSIGSGIQSIVLHSNLPAIIDPVIIDATTQPGYQGMPLIELDGSFDLSLFSPSSPSLQGSPGFTTSPGWESVGLRLFAGNTTVEGLAINRFQKQIWIQGPSGGNVIEGSFLGPDVTGTKLVPPVVGSVQEDSGVGIEISDGSSGNVIGGLTPQTRNVISGNYGIGIDIENSTGNLIEGNLIGTDVTGTLPLGNGQLFAFGSGIDLDGSDRNVVGGTQAGAQNVISANAGGGVVIDASSETLVQGNLIGTDIAGSHALGNHFNGVTIVHTFTGAGNDLIGGTVPGAGNVISGNLGDGVAITLAGTQDQVQGNLIGTDLTGTQPLGNTGDGVLLDPGLNGTGDHRPVEDSVGGTVNGAGNTIAFNFGRGVNVLSGDRIGILGNAIFGNSGGLGIDLNGDGVTVDDDGDLDSGPNDLQNFPVIAQAIAGATTHVVASLNSQPEEDDIISFYANSLADPSGFGEGQRYLGSVIAHTDASGNATVELDLPARTGGGEFLTATATDPDGNTSEFSLAVDLTPTATIDSPSVKVGPAATTATFTVTLSVPSSQHVLIDYTTVDVTAHSGIDYTATTGTLDIPPGSLTGTIVVAVAANANAGPNLTFNLVLSLPQNVALASTTATATLIPSGQPAGELAFSVANDAIQEDEGTVTITVTRSNGSAGVVTVDYTTSGGTGQAGVDYTAASGILMFPDGVTTRTFTVPLLDNPNATTPVTVTLMLSDPTGDSTLGSQATATLTITPAPQFQGINVQEGSIGRSYIRYLDLHFKGATGLQSLIDSLNTTNPLLVLNFLGLNGTGNANVPLFASEVSIVNSNTLRIDFGRGGITGDPTSSGGDGYYQISVESQDAATITTKTFFRLFGDVNGDGVVDNSDIAIVNAAIGRSGSNLAADVDGSLAVNTIDLQYARNAKKKDNKLSFDLHLDD